MEIFFGGGILLRRRPSCGGVKNENSLVGSFGWAVRKAGEHRNRMVLAGFFGQNTIVVKQTRLLPPVPPPVPPTQKPVTELLFSYTTGEGIHLHLVRNYVRPLKVL